MPASAVSDACWASLSDYIANATGLYFPRERWPDMQRAMADVAQEFGFDSIEACTQWLLSTPATRAQIEVLATHLTIGETYFFREKKTFTTIAEKVLPELIRARRHTRRLKLWSAACCSGEEAYSLAILLRQCLPDIDQWQISILATDINPKFLKKAAAGTYSDWSFRTTPPEFKARYFKKRADNRYVVAPEIQAMVTFMHLNLVDDVYPSPLTSTDSMDLIFCRNVLIYFSGEQNTAIVQKLHACLSDDSWMVVSPCETSQTLFAQFSTRNFPGVILYQKKKSQAPDSSSTESVTENLAPEVAAPECAESDSHEKYDASIESVAAEPVEPPNEKINNASIARALANQGKLEDALAACEHWIAADKLDASAQYLRGIILTEQNKTNEARQAFQCALYLRPDFVLAHYASGNLARNDGKSDVADKHFSNALRLLKGRDANELIDESEGMTVGRLREALTGQTETRSTP